ncbi:P-loop containing nucleoside triphosphate hydrolase protein [Thelephora ganbajun]|uniref:P-loop containing nucleoside triphosphate hydrolase protein n=1 Tax=Thelephora ganbajun TaxID=370292 RepID=A0ACB6ZQF6_THEGA|nr:P-loop containing nucleoside triphosphate hydrolase protein [Thelephora ganbajun]
MATLNPEPFGKPTLLLASLLLKDTNDTTFASNGLLDTEPSGGCEEENASSEQSPSWTARADGIGSTGDDESSAFTSNRLLGGPTQTTSQTSSTLLSVLGSDFFDSQTLVGSTFTQTSDLLSDIGYAGPSIRATTFEGKPVFIKKKAQTDRTKKRTATAGKATGLLDVPLHRLMDELAVSASDPSRNTQITLESVSSPSSKVHGELWVDRYRPQQYTDLLGDDRVHREVMAWVKEWDYCVFGKSKGKQKVTEDGQYFDEYRRPREKLLLISGPPGLGKTTLAHVVAKQAGYKVFEINASDARSGAVVDDRIRPALESGAAIGSSKPVLVVVDEIDGATGAGDSSAGFIQKFIALTQDNPKMKRQKNDKSERRPLLRPIICICNDLYASSLTKLRAHARIIRLARAADVHLVKRLRDICERERLRADSRALTALVGIAQGDLRGCLNTLQFLKRRGVEVTEVVVRKATHGMKEADASQISVLNDLFCPLQRKRVKDLGMTEEEESRYVGRLARTIESTGAPDKVALGCFEHYPNLNKHDSTFVKYSKAIEWLGNYDLLSNGMRSEREYGLMNYLPYMIVPFYPLFQERGAQKVERPKADWENYTKTKAHEEIYKSLSKCLRSACAREAGCFRHLLSERILQLELSPYINRIISPPLRPVNSQIIKPEEKAVLNRLVDLMVALDLRFVQDKTEDGSVVYRLDPPVDVFVTYDGKRSSDIAISRYAIRQLVANEIDARVSPRQVDGVSTGRPGRKSLFGKRLREEPTEEGLSSVVSDSRNKRQKVGGKIDIADRPPTDFFGRPIAVKPVSKPASKIGLNKTTSQAPVVSYKFNEGNSAAVRKAVKVSSFL